MLIVFGAIGIPVFTHFFKTHELPIATGLSVFTHFFKTISISGILAVVFSVLFITYVLFEYDYIPYNISKGINWESEDDLEHKLGYYGYGDNINQYPKNEFVEGILIPLILVILIIPAVGFIFLRVWKRIKKLILINEHAFRS